MIRMIKNKNRDFWKKKIFFSKNKIFNLFLQVRSIELFNFFINFPDL